MCEVNTFTEMIMIMIMMESMEHYIWHVVASAIYAKPLFCVMHQVSAL